MNEHFLEDLFVGQSLAAIPSWCPKAFAMQFGAQPFHLDEEAAKGSLFGELVASGWHTAALTMKLLVEGEYRPASGFIVGRADELRWPNPTKPGDVLTASYMLQERSLEFTRVAPENVV